MVLRRSTSIALATLIVAVAIGGTSFAVFRLVDAQTRLVGGWLVPLMMAQSVMISDCGHGFCNSIPCDEVPVVPDSIFGDVTVVVVEHGAITARAEHQCGRARIEYEAVATAALNDMEARLVHFRVETRFSRPIEAIAFGRVDEGGVGRFAHYPLLPW